jgi:hypothetical protein
MLPRTTAAAAAADAAVSIQMCGGARAAKVAQLCHALPVAVAHQNVGRLQVAMPHPAAVHEPEIAAKAQK